MAAINKKRTLEVDTNNSQSGSPKSKRSKRSKRSETFTVFALLDEDLYYHFKRKPESKPFPWGQWNQNTATPKDYIIPSVDVYKLPNDCPIRFKIGRGKTKEAVEYNKIMRAVVKKENVKKKGRCYVLNTEEFRSIVIKFQRQIQDTRLFPCKKCKRSVDTDDVFFDEYEGDICEKCCDDDNTPGRNSIDYMHENYPFDVYVLKN